MRMARYASICIYSPIVTPHRRPGNRIKVPKRPVIQTGLCSLAKARLVRGEHQVHAGAAPGVALHLQGATQHFDPFLQAR